jgi:hypothetical protein
MIEPVYERTSDAASPSAYMFDTRICQSIVVVMMRWYACARHDEVRIWEAFCPEVVKIVAPLLGHSNSFLAYH